MEELEVSKAPLAAVWTMGTEQVEALGGHGSSPRQRKWR